MSSCNLEHSKSKLVMDLFNLIKNNADHFERFMRLVLLFSRFENSNNKLFIDLQQILVDNLQECRKEIDELVNSGKSKAYTQQFLIHISY